MKPYLISLAVGILVGGIYALLRVRSPAPPVIALVGLLGLLIGEQGVGIAVALLWPQSAPAATAVAPTSASPSNNLTGSHHAP